MREEKLALGGYVKFGDTFTEFVGIDGEEIIVKKVTHDEIAIKFLTDVEDDGDKNYGSFFSDYRTIEITLLDENKGIIKIIVKGDE